MTRHPRGHALIIDNEVFDNDIYPKRHGSQLDANNLDLLFEGLGFKVRCFTDLQLKNMGVSE